MLFTVGGRTDGRARSSIFYRNRALTESLAKLLQTPLLGRLIKLFAKVATAERYMRRRSQSRIVGQHRLAEEAHGILKLGAMWFPELERFHHGAPAETGKLRLSLPT